VVLDVDGWRYNRFPFIVGDEDSRWQDAVSFFNAMLGLFPSVRGAAHP